MSVHPTKLLALWRERVRVRRMLMQMDQRSLRDAGKIGRAHV